MGEKMDFDQAAATWDEDPIRVKLAADIVEAVKRNIPLTTAMDVLDFGCGTGLLSTGLHPFVGSIRGVDSSRGMLDIFDRKIHRQSLSNITTQYLDSDRLESLSGRYHLIVCGMTLHHVPTLAPLLTQFHERLSPGGILCLADLDLEDGQFHGSNEGIFHFGFDRVTLAQTLTAVGFENVRDTTAASITKPASDGRARTFTVFLMIGERARALPFRFQ